MNPEKKQKIEKIENRTVKNFIMIMILTFL